MNKSVSKRGILLVSLFIACTIVVIWRRFGTVSENPGQQQARDSLFQQKRQMVYNAKVYLKAVRLAETGDIVVRLGSDMTSEMLRRMNLRDPAYSHAGIISRENDTIFVYHALGGELNPDQPLRRQPLWTYGRPADNKALGLFRIKMDSSTRQRLVKTVKDAYASKIPFDTAFDLQTKQRFYCTEFVAYSFEKAFQDTAFFHRSVSGNKIYIGVDDITGNSHTKKIAAWKY